MGPVTGPKWVSLLASSCNGEGMISGPNLGVELEGVGNLDESNSSLSSSGSSVASGYAPGEDRTMYLTLVLGYSSTKKSGLGIEISDEEVFGLSKYLCSRVWS